MNGKELREQAFRHIQTHPYLWGKWNEARDDHERLELMAEVIAEQVAEYCIGEMYANQEDISFAVDRVRRKFERG